jgi:hypothetical protein
MVIFPYNLNIMSKIFIAFLACTVLNSLSPAAAQKREYYEIKIYRVNTQEQIKQLDQYFRNAYLPALHKLGIKKIGVFHDIGNDTLADKRIVLFIPLRSLEQVSKVEDIVLKDDAIRNENYWTAAYNTPPFKRVESILLQSFIMMPTWKAPSLSGNKADHVYELRSYESANERLYRKKVHMFNEGGEVALFNRLQFNAVFYAEVLAGSRMPNLMYMTSFNNMKERDAHWASFVADPEWKKLSGMEEYKNTVSTIDRFMLRPAEYSEL